MGLWLFPPKVTVNFPYANLITKKGLSPQLGLGSTSESNQINKENNVVVWT